MVYGLGLMVSETCESEDSCGFSGGHILDRHVSLGCNLLTEMLKEKTTAVLHIWRCSENPRPRLPAIKKHPRSPTVQRDRCGGWVNMRKAD